jgi:hypothetical protein
MWGMLMSGCAVQMDACGADADNDAQPYGREMQVVVDLREDLQTHFNFSFIRSSYAVDTDNNADFKLNSFDTLLDWHGLTGGFFVSGGALASRTLSTTMQSSPAQGMLTRSAVALTSGLATNNADLRNITPYLGLGWASRKIQKKGWAVLSDVGMLYRGRTTLSLTNTNCLLNNVGALGMCQGFDYGSAGAIMNDGRNNVTRYVPVLRAGVSYLF